MATEKFYMVELDLRDSIAEEFFDLVPHQRMVVNEYFRKGYLLNYALSIDQGKAWATFQVSSLKQLNNLLNRMPLLKYMESRIHLLNQYNGIHTDPIFSLN